MLVTTDYVDLPADGSPMRALVAAPKTPGSYPGLICYSDIFALTGPTVRACVRLAGHGFVVYSPEFYHRIEPAGTVLQFEPARERALRDAAKTTVDQFDADFATTLRALRAHPMVKDGAYGAAGFCIGGHLAFRAALDPAIRAAAPFYATGLHADELGGSIGVDSLRRAAEIRGKLSMVFGDNDPHIPSAGRARVDEALKAAGVFYEIVMFPGEHAFMRDEGPRWDPESTDKAYAHVIAFFRANLN